MPVPQQHAYSATPAVAAVSAVPVTVVDPVVIVTTANALHPAQIGSVAAQPGQQPAFAAAPAFPLCFPSDAQLEARLVGVAAQHTRTLHGAAVELQKQYETSISLHAMLLDVNDVHPTVLLAALATDKMKRAQIRKPQAMTLSAAAVSDIACRVGKPFTLDCSAVEAPSPCKVEALKTAEAVLQANLANQCIYMHAPYKLMPRLVQHYLDCKKLSSENTAGVFVVSHDMYKKYPELFANMSMLQTYVKGSPINMRHWESAPATLTRTQTKLHVLYDGIANPQPAVAPNVDEAGETPPSLHNPPPLSAVFTGVISGAKATIGIDNFCQGYGFISPAFVELHGLKTVPVQHLHVQLGDGKSSASTNLACKVQVKLASYSTTTWLLVMSIPGQYDALLGDHFLSQNNAFYMSSKKCLVVQTATRKHVILNKEAVASQKQQNRTPSMLLSSMQFCKLVKQGHSSCFCLVQREESAVDVVPAEPYDLSKYPKEIADLISKFPSVFPSTLAIQPLRDDMPQVIPTPPSTKPPNMPTYRYSPIQLQEIEAQVRDLIAQGLIQPSTSPYGAPVLLVKKKDGTMRMCVDYRALNSVTVKNAYPLPRIDELLDKIQGSKYFSSLDLLSGYHQLTLQPTDVPKTAFKTHIGLWEYKVLCFGLSNAPSVFQSIMNKVFSKYPNVLNKIVLVYMDDILILSKTFEEHLSHLQQVFKILQQEKFSVKLKKCQFFKSELKFLGHIISSDGISPDPDKISAVQAWPLPRTQTELRGFLGLTNYFRRFIEGYASIAAPLINLTKKSEGKSIILSPEATASFQQLKECLVSAKTLAIPDFSKPFRLETDASQIGLGGVLSQEGKPVAYESKKFSSTEMNYSTTDRELYAVVHCLKKWKVYMIHNSDNVIVTDHKPNTSVQTKSGDDLSPRQVRWIEFLMQFSCKWIYEKGDGNIADPLSRFNSYLMALLQLDSAESLFNENTLQLPKLLHHIALASKSDPYIPANPSLTAELGVYFFKDRIYVPDVDNLRTNLISLHHDTLHAGHMGKNHTLQNLQRWFYWPNMHVDVTHYVAHCHTCQTAKSGKTGTQGLLHPLSIPDRPWWSISVDFVTGLHQTKDGHDAILTIVDRLTRMVHLVPTHTTCDALQFANMLKLHVISKHGCPADIVSDRGSVFTGKFWTEVCHLLQMHMSMSTAFHPQSDGSTEIVNKLVEQVLRCHCMDNPIAWDDNLCMVEFAINNSYQESIKHTPFFLNFGQHPVTPVTIETIKLSKNPSAAKWSSDLQDTLTRAKHNLQLAKDRQKSYADAGRQELTFNVNDHVLLSTTNLQPKTGKRKLYPRFLGPFKVTHCVNDVAYRLDLPSTMKIHPVFHVSLLKCYKDSGHVQPPSPILIDGVEEFEVEQILQSRLCRSGSRSLEEFLIKWKGYGFEHCTWEKLTNLTHCPELLATFRKQQLLQLPVSSPSPQPAEATTPAAPASKRRRR